MKKAEIVTAVTRTFGKVGFQLKKHSPEILVGVGVVGTVGSLVMACKATLKVNDVIDQTKEDLEKIHTAAETGMTEGGQEYSAEDNKKDLAIVYTQTGFKLVKLYAPAVVLCVASLGCMIKSNDILRTRNAALAAAYATVNKGFKEYRDRVVDRFGKEVDKELKYNIKAKEYEETIIDGKGKEKKVKKTEMVADANSLDDFERIFGELNPNYEKNSDYNFMFLRGQQQIANDILVSRGYLLFNEVLEMLGYEQTKVGAISGWVYDPDNPESDGYVDFGIMDMAVESTRDFINGKEKAVLLKFNVDGYILDRAFPNRRGYREN